MSDDYRIPLCDKPNMADETRDLTTPAGRLRWAMARKNLRAVDIWRPLGIDSGAMSRTIAGDRKIQQHELAPMAKLLGVRPDWLLLGSGSPDGEDDLKSKAAQPSLPPTVAVYSSSSVEADERGLWVPLISWVAAGTLTEVIDWSEFDDVKRIYAPDLDPGGQWIALRVDGSSMNKISPPDSIIFVNLRQKALVSNACYVFTDERGEATYKRYRPDGWESVSYLPQPDVEPEGAITIIGRVRRSMIDM